MADIHLASQDDAAAVAAIYGPFCESTAISFEIVAPSPDVIADRIATVTKQFPWIVLDDGGSVAGYAYANRHHERAAYGWAVDTAIYVDPAYQRSGVGRALYTALLAVLRLQGYFKACAGITLPNQASVALHDVMGFRPIGIYQGIGYKAGRWHDVAWYQVSLRPERANPEHPVSVTALLGSTGWNQATSNGLRYYRPR
jgi:phosphinothricin acetyltransferase